MDKAGDDLLERLYDRHAEALYAYALHLTRHEADTRDLLQEVFTRIATSPSCLRGVRDERGFLLRMIHHAAIDQFRRRRTRENAVEGLMRESASLFETADDPDGRAFRFAVDEALGALPEEQRTVVHLKLWSDLTFEAIADVLGISPNTAASRYRYGMNKLREQLRPLYEELR